MSDTNEQVFSYIARCDTCKRLQGAVVDEPPANEDPQNRRMISRWLKDGLKLERVPIEEARQGPWGCNCPKKGTARR